MFVESNVESKLLCIFNSQSLVNVNGKLEDGLWSLGSNSLNVHSSVRRRNKDWALSRAVQQNGKVVLAPHILSLNDKDLVDCELDRVKTGRHTEKEHLVTNTPSSSSLF